MPQTFTQFHYHIVFSTRHRAPTIIPDIRQRVWEYLGGIIRAEGGIPRIVGGVEDHVHLLVTLRQTIQFAELMRILKSRSSTWAHETFRKRIFGGNRDTERSPSVILQSPQ